MLPAPGQPGFPAGATRVTVTRPPNAQTPGINIRSQPAVAPANRIGGSNWGSPVNILADAGNGWVRVQAINSDNGALIEGFACNTCPENNDGVPYLR